MKKFLQWGVIILGIMTFMSFGQQNPEQDFVNKAVMANRFEIAMAQQANERSSNEAVKAYSQMLIDEHQKVLNELQEYANSKGLTISDQLDQMHQGEVNALGELGADAYDKSFRNAAVASHEKSIALYESAGADDAITDTTLKTWISDKLPSLRTHLTQAQELRLDNGGTSMKKLPPIVDSLKMNK